MRAELDPLLFFSLSDLFEIYSCFCNVIFKGRLFGGDEGGGNGLIKVTRIEINNMMAVIECFFL